MTSHAADPAAALSARGVRARPLGQDALRVGAQAPCLGADLPRVLTGMVAANPTRSPAMWLPLGGPALLGPAMARRWTAAGLLTAQKRFRRIKGYRDMPILEKALRGNDVDLTEKVA